MLPTTPWTYLISSADAGGVLSGGMVSWAPMPYFLGAMRYGEFCGLVGASCLYLCKTFWM